MRQKNIKLVVLSTRILQVVIWMCLALVMPNVLQAHVDTLIRIKGTNLVGLPKNYEPAEFDTNAFRLRLARHEVTFSPFLKSLFDAPHELRFLASWYHERSTLPPCLVVEIRPKNKDFSYSILFNMDTLDVIDVSVTLKESDTVSRGLPIAFSDREKKEMRKSIKTFK